MYHQKKAEKEEFRDTTLALRRTPLMPINVFHQVEPLTLPCVTRISRGPKEKRFARVLDPIGHDYVCPFSHVIEEDTLWEHVRQAL